MEPSGSKESWRNSKEPERTQTWRNPIFQKIQFFSDSPQWQANVGLTSKCFQITSSKNGHGYRHAFRWSHHGLSKQTNNCSFAKSMKNMIIFFVKNKRLQKVLSLILENYLRFFYGSVVHSLTWLFLSQFLTCKQIEKKKWLL